MHEAPFEVAIIVALEEERQGVLRQISVVNELWLDEERCDELAIPTLSGRTMRGVLVCSHNMGGIGISSLVEKVIVHWQPHFFCLTGITGAIKDSEMLEGDVIIPSQIVAYEQGVVKPDSTERRYEVYRPRWSLIRLAKEIDDELWTKRMTIGVPSGFADRRKPIPHFGVMASGEKVVRSEEFTDDLKEAWPKLIGVEMESAGLAHSLYQAGKSDNFIVIKGISDWADPNKDDSWRDYAIDSAAAYLAHFLSVLPKPVFPIADSSNYDEEIYSGPEKLCHFKRLYDVWRDMAIFAGMKPWEIHRIDNKHGPEEVYNWLWRKGWDWKWVSCLEAVDRLEVVKLCSKYRNM